MIWCQAGTDDVCATLTSKRHEQNQGSSMRLWIGGGAHARVGNVMIGIVDHIFTLLVLLLPDSSWCVYKLMVIAILAWCYVSSPLHSSCITIYSAGGQSFILLHFKRSNSIVGMKGQPIVTEEDVLCLLAFSSSTSRRKSYHLPSVCPYDFRFDVSTSIPRYSWRKLPANYAR